MAHQSGYFPSPRMKNAIGDVAGFFCTWREADHQPVGREREVLDHAMARLATRAPAAKTHTNLLVQSVIPRGLPHL